MLSRLPRSDEATTFIARHFITNNLSSTIPALAALTASHPQYRKCEYTQGLIVALDDYITCTTELDSYRIFDIDIRFAADGYFRHRDSHTSMAVYITPNACAAR